MRLGVIASLFLLAACAEEPTVIDGSSPDAFNSSAEQARSELPIEDRLDFDSAIANVPGRSMADSEAEIARRARETYDGMTGEEVVAIGRGHTY